MQLKGMMDRARVLALGIAISMSGAPALAQVEEGMSNDMLPPSELDADSSAALARARSWLNEWNGQSDLLEAARIEIERVLEANPESGEARRRHGHYLLNRAMRNSRDYDADGLAKAEKALARAIELNARDAAAHSLLASVYRHQKRLDDARSALDRAESLGDTSAELHSEWADLLMDERKPEEALVRCKRIGKAEAGARDAADRCMLGPLKALGRVDAVERLYREIADRTPTSAWDRGNYAQFLLCTRRDTKAAAEQATRALSIMVYPHARTTLAGALYTEWAALANAGKHEHADAAWSKATAASDRAPALIVADACNAGFARPVLKALRDARRGPMFSPMETVMYAAEFAPAWLPGVFVLKVQGSGRGRGRETGQVFLNSESDYRDPRSITVRFTPEAATRYREKYAASPDEALRDRYVLVYGYARRQQIDFTSYGVPTGKFYYQTHIVVTDPDQVEVFDPEKPLPRSPAPATPATPEIKA